VQVADRFHLLQNLGQALDQFLTREHRVLAHVAASLREGDEEPDEEPGVATDASAPLPPEAPEASIPRTRLEREHAAVRRQARYARVVELAGAGCSLGEVARRAGISRATVRRYLRAGHYQSCATHARPAPHMPAGPMPVMPSRGNCASGGRRANTTVRHSVPRFGSTGSPEPW
jgi:hypothetical protein